METESKLRVLTSSVFHAGCQSKLSPPEESTALLMTTPKLASPLSLEILITKLVAQERTKPALRPSHGVWSMKSKTEEDNTFHPGRNFEVKLPLLVNAQSKIRNR